MSPELERLLAALYEWDTCEPGQRPQRQAFFEHLVAEALQNQPEVRRETFMEALRIRYREFRRARRQPPTMPPSA